MTVNLRIYGRVQGVFFRKSAKIEAERLGLTGWVKNLDDGSVEANIGGEKRKLEEFVAWCKKGSPFTKVKKVEETWSETNGGWDTFEIY